MESDESACLFLNLYHCLLLHAFLVVGVPTTLFKWPTFFGSYSYEAFGDVFSLAELEHCIIRAGEQGIECRLWLFAAEFIVICRM